VFVPNSPFIVSGNNTPGTAPPQTVFLNAPTEQFVATTGGGLVPDELTFVTRRIESKIPSNRLRNDHGACESSRGCRGRTTRFGEIVAVGSRDAFDHPKAAEPA
jgi:hypothetical protein